MVRDSQWVIGREARGQILEAEGRLPDMLIACVGGGSNSIGLFSEFLGDEDVRMIGVEAGGAGTGLRDHAARFSGGKTGILHRPRSYVLPERPAEISTAPPLYAALTYPPLSPGPPLLPIQQTT